MLDDIAELPEFLTRLQRGRGLSRTEWARRSGVNPASLWRWQNGETVPRDTELANALDALPVSDAERKQGFYLLAKARGGQNIRRIAPLAGIPLVRGDLLRALRQRARLSQREAALKTGVRANNLSRWEGGTHLPDGDTLRRLAQLYHALPEEIAALTEFPCVNWGDSASELPTDFGDYHGDLRVLELRYLIAIGCVAESPGAVSREEVRLRIGYASYLSLGGRTDAAIRELNKAKESDHLRRDPELFADYCWEWAAIARKSHLESVKRHWIERLERVVRDHPTLSDKWRTRFGGYRMLLLSDLGETNAALSVWKPFFAGVERAEDAGLASWAWAGYSRVLRFAGAFDAALDAAANMEQGTAYADTFYHYVSADVLAVAGRRSEAAQAYQNTIRSAAQSGLTFYETESAAKIAELER